MSNAPLVMCPPTTGCGKAMEMVRTINVIPEGWTLPENCPHCGKQQFPSSVYLVPSHRLGAGDVSLYEITNPLNGEVLKVSAGTLIAELRGQLAASRAAPQQDLGELLDRFEQELESEFATQQEIAAARQSLVDYVARKTARIEVLEKRFLDITIERNEVIGKRDEFKSLAEFRLRKIEADSKELSDLRAELSFLRDSRLTEDELWQLDQAIEDAEALPRADVQIESLRRIYEKLRLISQSGDLLIFW